MPVQVSDRLQRWFQDYGSYHQTRGNKLCHDFGIPMIVASVLGLLACVPLGPVDLGLAVWGLISLWYWSLDWRVGVPFSALALGLWFPARLVPLPALWAMFVLGWILQFLGHIRYEKKSPAFFTNLRHLLIGPLWVFARRAGYMGA
ncbi:MAG: DUF962 domain-containing protein [Planctomycetota bacterium]|nr:MAG: DUF962 domain-containing protein [Planctomycetota bacterium]